MTEQGQYIYGIVKADEERNFGPIGIGSQNHEVSIICYRDIGAVISSSPVMKYPVSRANTIAHQKVMEEAMKYYPLLPVRFGTVGEGTELVKEKVLRARYDEIKKLLTYVEDKMELGLKVLWMNMQDIYKEIIDENQNIRSLRDRIMSKSIRPQRDQVRLGEMVKKALDLKRIQDEKAILNHLKGLWVEHKVDNGFGDQMITNSSFLIAKDSEKKFDEVVNKLSAKYDGRVKIKYVGPVPPCNFIEIVVKW